MSEQPEECSRCDTETEELTFYPATVGRNPDQWLCCYCEVSMEDRPVKSMAAMFHVLERRMLAARGGRGE